MALLNAGVEFRILGPLEVIDEGRPLPLGSKKQRALLTLFLLSPGEALSRDRLIDELWHSSPPLAAETTLRSYLSRLRSVLGGERLQTRTTGYTLALAPEELDAREFEHLLSAGRLRLEHAQASLEELGALAEPPLTKDAIAGRIRRLLAMADKRAEELGIPDTEASLTPEMLADEA